MFALTLSTSTYAGSKWKPKQHHHKRGCGHDSIPLDGGLSILLLGAAAYGVKKIRDNKNA